MPFWLNQIYSHLRGQGFQPYSPCPHWSALDLVFQQLSVFSALNSNFQSKTRSATLNFGPDEDFSPVSGTKDPQETRGKWWHCSEDSWYGGKEGDISLRGCDIRENASDNQRGWNHWLWSVNLTLNMSKFLSSFKKQSWQTNLYLNIKDWW